MSPMGNQPNLHFFPSARPARWCRRTWRTCWRTSWSRSRRSAWRRSRWSAWSSARAWCTRCRWVLEARTQRTHTTHARTRTHLSYAGGQPDPPPGPGAPGAGVCWRHAHSAHTRHTHARARTLAMQVVSLTLRQGLVHPVQGSAEGTHTSRAPVPRSPISLIVDSVGTFLSVYWIWNGFSTIRPVLQCWKPDERSWLILSFVQTHVQFAGSEIEMKNVTNPGLA